MYIDFYSITQSLLYSDHWEIACDEITNYSLFGAKILKIKKSCKNACSSCSHHLTIFHWWHYNPEH